MSSHAAQTVLTVGRGVIIELIRRKDLYVLGMLMITFSIGAVSGRRVGIEEAATGTFLLNLGMTLAYIFAHLLTLLLSVRQVPSELESRTIYPILARPVTRSQFLLGKWLACSGAGMLAYALFFLMVWISTPRLESYDGALLAQALLLQMVSLSLTAACGICFSICLPKGAALLLLGLLVFFGSLLVGFTQSVAEATLMEGGVNWAMMLLPDFSKLNLTTRYTDGIPRLSHGVFAGLVLHGLFYTWLLLFAGCRVFGRRAL